MTDSTPFLTSPQQVDIAVQPQSNENTNDALTEDIFHKKKQENDAAVLLNNLRKKKKTNWEVSTIGRVYVLLVTIEILFLVAISIMVLVKANDIDDSTSTTDRNKDKRENIFTGVQWIIASLGFYYFALDSILLENIFQFWSSFLIHVLITCYISYNYAYRTKSQIYNVVALYVVIICAVLQTLYMVLAPFVQNTFGWRLYKHVGGNVMLRGKYRTSQIFFSLLKLDFLLGLLLVLLASFYLFSETSEYIINSLALVVTLLWGYLGYSAVRLEKKPYIYIFVCFAILEPSYISYKLYQMQSEGWKSNYVQFIVTGSIAIVVRALLLLWGYWSFKNFGFGLRNQVFLRQQDKQTNPLEEVVDYAGPLCNLQ